jgi:replicative DNA helicase
LSSLYKRVNRGLSGKSILVEVNDHEAVQKFVDQQPDADYYESIYLYEQKHKDQFDRTNSVAGITDIKTNRVVFDLDSKMDLEQARHDALLLCSRLIQDGIPDEGIQVYSSGNKGYHVELATDEFFERREIKNIVNNYAGDLSTIDYKILDEARIFRMPLTKHPVSGLYKVPITLLDLELLDSNEIREASNEILPKHYDLMSSAQTITPPTKFSLIKNLNTKEQAKLQQIELSYDRPDFSKRPKHLSPAKFALQEGFIPPGQSHHAFMILASTYRMMGYNKEIAYNMLKATNRLRAQRYGIDAKPNEEIWNNVIQSIFSNNWRGGTYSEEQDRLLLEIKETYKIKDDRIDDEKNGLVTSLDLISNFSNFAENIDNNTIRTGLKSLDRDVRLTTSMLVALLGAPGSAKTSWSIRFLNELNRSELPSVFFSLDMGQPLLTTRLLQKHTGLSGDAIFEIYKNKDEEKKKLFQDILIKEYSNVKFCFRSGITCEDIRAYMMELQNQGIKPKLLVVDYLECVHSQFSDSTASKAYIALRLKDIANEFETCVLLLTQPVKNAGDPSYPLNSYQKIKGTGVIAEQASIVLTIHRPGFSPTSPEDDRFVTVTAVKNRMGMLGQYDFTWEGLTGAVEELDEEQTEELKKLRDRIERERSQENGYDGI